MIRIVSSIPILLIALVVGVNSSFSQSEQLFPVLKANSVMKESHRAGFIDKTGALKIGFKFYYASDFSEGLSAILKDKNGKWGYVNENGEVVIETQFEEAASFQNGLAKVKKDGKSFFINREGKKAFEHSYTLYGFKEDVSPASLSGKWGFVNSAGAVIIPFKFDHANPYYEGLSAVTQGDLLGYIDKAGGWAITPRFDPMPGYTDPLFLPNFSDGLAVYRNNEKYGFINKEGLTVIPAAFDRAEGFSEGLGLVKLNEKIGYLKKDGEYAIALKFDGGQKFSDGLAAVKMKGKWGFIDTAGALKIQPQYDATEPFKDGLAKVTKYDEKNGSTIIAYINKSGRLIYSWKQ